MKLSDKNLDDLKVGDIVRDKNGRFGYIYYLLFRDKYGDGNLGYVQIRWMDNDSLPTETSNCWSVKGKNKWTKYTFVGHISDLGKHYETTAD